MICSLGSCDKPVQARTFCKRHYQQWYATGSPEIRRPNPRGTPEERFWRYANRGADDACWLWIGHADKDGYGWLRIHASQSPVRAHRFAYELFYGPIPDGLCVLHKCPCGGNPACVNPAHLKPGTNRENIEDKIKHGRSRHSEASRAKRSAIFKGRTFTPEWLAKIARKNEKLTDEQVREIRALIAQGVSQYVIAERFQVHQGTISNISRGKHYQHVI